MAASCASGPTPNGAPAPDKGAPSALTSSAPAQAVAPAEERAKALVQGASASPPVPPASSPRPGPDSPPTGASLTPEEQSYLESYLSHLSYMVYCDEAAGADPKLAVAAVSQANRYLIEKLGRSVIDFDQIERNKKDQQASYESETGGSMELNQYLAQKFNADVYVEIDFTLSGEKRDDKYYAQAQGSMKIYDTSTATLLGSVVLGGQTAFSPSSAESAAVNAVAGSVWAAMPKVVGQTRELVRNSLTQGVRYEVVLQKTPDSRQVSQFRRALGKKVREVEQASYAPSSTRLYVYTFKKGDWVEDAVYAAASASGMNDLSLVYSRGKSYTFDTGL